MDVRSVTLASVVLSAILVAVAVIKLDLMTAAVSVLYIVTAVYPMRRDGRFFCTRLTGFVAVGAAALVVMNVLDILGAFSDVYWANVPGIWIAELLCLPMIALPTGFFAASMFEIYGESHISRRWMLVFGIAFAMAFSGVYIFTVGFDLWFTGQPFYNAYTGGYVEHLPPEIVRSNRTQMAAATCATVSTVPIAMYVRAVIKTRTLDDICGGGEQ